MNAASKTFAFIAYLIPLFGPLIVLLFRRNDEYAVFHARQSLRLLAVAILAPLIWAAISYVLLFIPFLGMITAAATFAVVILVFIAVIFAWISGMLNVLRSSQQAVPMFGGR